MQVTRLMGLSTNTEHWYEVSLATQALTSHPSRLVSNNQPTLILNKENI